MNPKRRSIQNRTDRNIAGIVSIVGWVAMALFALRVAIG